MAQDKRLMEAIDRAIEALEEVKRAMLEAEAEAPDAAAASAPEPTAEATDAEPAEPLEPTEEPEQFQEPAGFISFPRLVSEPAQTAAQPESVMQVPQGQPYAVPQGAVGRNCPNCGKPVALGSKFCMSCGTPISSASAPAAAPKTGGGFCLSCGAPLKPGDKFCMKCGTRV